MELMAIREHLRLARLALGAEHPLSTRIETIERQLTPGDPLWRDDAVSAENGLLAISTGLEQLPKVMPAVAPGAARPADGVQAQIPAGVNEAIRHIADAIELL